MKGGVKSNVIDERLGLEEDISGLVLFSVGQPPLSVLHFGAAPVEAHC